MIKHHHHSYAAIARSLNVSGEAVRKWFVCGRIPADRVLSVSRATAWQVTPHQLRPDIYPNPTDGLPPEVSTQQQEVA